MDNVTVFWGADHKTGTTMLAQSYSEIMSEKRRHSVLLLSLSENRGDDYFDDETACLDDVRNRLACGIMNEKVIKEYSSSAGAIDRIHGLTNPQDMFGYTLEMVDELIFSASKAYDKVIIDSGTGLHSPLTLSALKWGGRVVFVITQQESAIRNLERLSDDLRKLGIYPHVVAVNKYIKGDFKNLPYIAQRSDMVQGTMKTVIESEFGNQAETDRKTILYYGEKQYEKDVRNLI